MTERLEGRLKELDDFAKGIESNVYTSCLINIFPQDFDNIYWAIKTIKNQKELIESYGRISEGMTNDYEKLLEQNQRYKQALEEIIDMTNVYSRHTMAGDACEKARNALKGESQ